MVKVPPLSMTSAQLLFGLRRPQRLHGTSMAFLVEITQQAERKIADGFWASNQNVHGRAAWISSKN